MAGCAENMQPSKCLDPFSEDNVGAAACHIGRDGDRSFLTGSCHNFRFCFVVLGIEYRMSGLSFAELFA